MASTLPSRPRIIGSNAHKYTGKKVSITGEVINISKNANTITLRTADDETMIVLLQNNTSRIEMNLLTEVAGKLVSRGQIEASFVNQLSSEETANFNKSMYVEMNQVIDAYRIFHEC